MSESALKEAQEWRQVPASCFAYCRWDKLLDAGENYLLSFTKVNNFTMIIDLCRGINYYDNGIPHGSYSVQYIL